MTSPIDSSSSSAVLGSPEETSPLAEELAEKFRDKGVNIGQLIVETYNLVEESSHKKANLKVDALEAHEKKLKTITDLLSAIETQLANPQAKEVNMAGQSALVEEMRQLLNHKFFAKTVWTREEAEAIKTAAMRNSQDTMQKIQHLASDVNQELEKEIELLQIARKCLEMLHELFKTLIQNQQPR